MNVPLFLSSPLNSDAIYYDLQAQCVANGGVLYRDMLETNLPGAVWIHSFVRAIAGDSSFALRAFDLVAFASIVFLLSGCGVWVAGVERTEPPASQTSEGSLRSPPATRHTPSIVVPTFVFACCLFYLPLTPWSQCQRDLWMLLPALVALYIRATTVQSLQNNSRPRVYVLSLLEGICWGTAFWIKPHVAIPAIAVLMASVLLTGWSRRVAMSFSCILPGGILIGAVGSAWMITSGAWPHFWDTQLNWNTEYLAAREHWSLLERLRELINGFAPWSWLHLIALPLAVITLTKACRSRLQHASAIDQRQNYRFLLMALYIGWMLQIVLLQHTFAYIQVPAVLLAIAVIVDQPLPIKSVSIQRAVPAAFLLLAFCTSNVVDSERIQCWSDCVWQPATTTNAAIKLRPKLDHRPDQLWKEYPAIVDFLRSQNVREQDIFVYHWSNLSLYTDLNLTPPHRYVITDSHKMLFPTQSSHIRDTIDRSPYRFAVTDLGALGFTTAQADQLVDTSDTPTKLPPSVTNRFPFTLPIIYRSGTLCVHERVETNMNQHP